MAPSRFESSRAAGFFLEFPFSMEDQINSLDTSRATRRWVWLALLLLASGVLLRILFLNADPAYSLWPGYLADEGRWTEQARRLILFGSPHFDTWYSRVHVALAPLFQLFITLSFYIFGVGFSSARIVSALSGAAILACAFLLLRRRLTPEGLLLTVAVLALQPDLLFLSRIAIPEMASMFFQFLAFWVLVSKRRTAKTAAWGGLLAAAALGCKGTAMPVVPILALIVWAVHGKDDPATRPARIAAFLGGVAAPAGAILVLALVAGLAPVLDFADLRISVAGFLALSTPYDAAAFLFERDYARVLNVLLLPLWTVAGLAMASGSLRKAGIARDIYVGSAIWVGASVMISAVLKYYPFYYSFHLLVPLALNLGSGLTLLQSDESGDTAHYLVDGKGWAARVAVAWLLLPLALMLARLTVAATDALNLPIERLSHRLALIAVLWLSLIATTWKIRRRPYIVGSVALPLVAVPLWALGVQASLFSGEFWRSNGVAELATWASVILVSALLTRILISRFGTTGTMWTWTFGYVLALSFVWILQDLPALANRTYTIAHASVALEEQLRSEGVIGTESAASVFLGNDLPYTEKTRGDGPLPNVVVVAFDRFPPQDLEKEYVLIGSYGLEFGRDVDLRPEQSILEVYRRVE